LNQRHFLVVGLFRGGGPVTVRLEEGPFVNQQLETGPGWVGVAPGMRLRVTYVSIANERDEDARAFPANMIYVVEI
jgi:hypothetical protein